LFFLGRFGLNWVDLGFRFIKYASVPYVMPSALQNSAAPRFTGEFCHKVEGRNRITIPSDWRFGEEVELFMIPKALKTCIAVMTKKEVDRLEEEANELSPEERSNFLDMLGSDLKRVTMDKGGRISIPDEYFEQLGFPKYKEVWLTGSINTFNIWGVTDFETFKAQDKLRKEELKRKLGI
jgi:division/cell wall cluster transcriptional repressor MraZ